MNWLWRTLGRSRKDKIHNEVTRKEMKQEITLIDKIRKRKLMWFGYVTRMEGNRLLAVSLYGQVEGTRSGEDNQRIGWIM